MRRAYKYRLYPNKGQTYNLEGMLITLRRLYNTALEQRKAAYETEKRSIKFAEQSRWFTEVRKTDKWFGQINRQAAQATLKRLDKSFQNFFRRVKSGEKAGYPRFKGRDHFDSIEFQSVNNGYKIKDKRIYVQGVGDLKIKLHRPYEGQVKTVTLKREADKWFLVLSCDLGDVPVEPSTNPHVGIDMGLSSFLTTSGGEHEPNPRYLKDELPELRRRGRAVSRKKKGGKNRRKAVGALRKIHAKVANQRKEHHHQTALKLVRRYGLIAAEELDIKGMLEDSGIQGETNRRRYTRSISDAAWGGFLSILTCKAERAGVSVVKVDPRGTTQGCSGCGVIVPKTIRDRWHECPNCGLSLDRDENAARNILARALQARTGPAGGNPGVTLGRPRSAEPQAGVSFMDLPQSSGAETVIGAEPDDQSVVAAGADSTRCVSEAKPPGRQSLRKPRKLSGADQSKGVAGSLKLQHQGWLWAEVCE